MNMIFHSGLRPGIGQIRAYLKRALANPSGMLNFRKLKGQKAEDAQIYL
jgi:hypothetical protein